MSKYYKIHKILLHANDFDHARKHVVDYFSKNTLINYDTVTVMAAESLSATQTVFWSEIEKSMAANRKVMEEFAGELKSSNIKSLDDILAVTDGYSCKLVHLIAHFLDGFIGIDTFFYNLGEDSHWVSSAEQEKIRRSPEKYWLIQVQGSFSSRTKASLLHDV